MTIADIAKQLGVSKSTVSRAFCDAYDISSSTRTKILEYAKSIGFMPDSVARSLRVKNTKVIGVIIPRFSIPFYAHAISGIQEVADEYGYKLHVCQSDESYKKECDAIDLLITSKVDGLIVSLSEETIYLRHIQKIHDLGLPLVLFNRATEYDTFSMVYADDIGGAEMMTRFLIGKGYRKIAYIAGPFNLAMSRRRLQGYQRIMAEYGLQYKDLIYESKSFTEENGYDIAEKIISEKGLDGIDAIFCICDNVAFGVIHYMKDHNIRIPDQIGVAGYTDEPVSCIIDPPLTTIRQPILEIGRKAMELIIEQIKYSNFSHKTIVVPVELKERASTK